jgi:hypothetical protein
MIEVTAAPGPPRQNHARIQFCNQLLDIVRYLLDSCIQGLSKHA